jgi:hypothetical protein
MAEKVIDQLAPNVRGMLRILHMPDVEDEDLPEVYEASIKQHIEVMEQRRIDA